MMMMFIFYLSKQFTIKTMQRHPDLLQLCAKRKLSVHNSVASDKVALPYLS